MPLVNSSILGNLNSGSVLPAAQAGINMGQGLIQFGQQQKAYNRQQAFSDALDEVVKQAGDFTTPEGQKAIVQGLAAKGFGQEAQEIAAKLPKPDYQPVDLGRAGYGAFDPRTGSITPSKDVGTGNPYYSKEGQKAIDHDTKLAGFQKDLAERYAQQASTLGTDVKKRNALVSDIYQKYGDLPEAQKFIDDTKNTPASIVSLGNGGLSTKDKLTLENRFRVDWGKEKRSYETQAQAYMNLKGIQSSKTYGTGIGDQALIDEFVRLQTGGRPTEAQYAQAISSYGLDDIVNKFTGKVKTGAKLSQQQREDILAAADEQMKNNHERLLSLKDEKEQELRDSGGEPTHVFQSSKYFDQIGKYFKEPSAAPAPGPAPKVSPAMIDLAKKALADPKASEAHKAAARKILGQ